MATYKDLAILVQKEALKAIQQSNSNTKQMLIKTGQDHVETDVYDVYDPLVYERTHELKNSFVTENEVNGLSLDNIRNDEGRDVATIVETGEGYTYPDTYGYGYGKPRPVMTNTAETLKDGRLIEAVSRDVNKLGYKTVK
ncbi:hypothetical protein [Bacillus swezeyi]|uniref:HK97 gp10 family phage protein n=1 Tax=Bacillus swezeyi TaxID=1925020 RepID=A0A5M8S0V8_9BACI|nr:hypothetical protein [Bacillus swezeyi]KAA6452714.1 hypothetical protein DX927_00340 [Bacillus swezeyi]TYS38081.1 hypothetical protein FZC77_00260 [Bacillus swezeyi]